MQNEQTEKKTGKAKWIVLACIILPLLWMFRIHSVADMSMLPYLQRGDYVLVNAMHYAMRVPLIGATIMEMDAPKRGDIVMVRFGGGSLTKGIRRIIGLPGDVVDVSDKGWRINTKPVMQVAETLKSWVDDGCTSRTSALYREELPDFDHQIMLSQENLSTDSKSWIIPEGQLFVMGDNRDFSEDSRTLGLVPQANVTGKVVGVAFHADFSGDCASGFQFQRIGAIAAYD
jgi:signal peptidase I